MSCPIYDDKDYDKEWTVAGQESWNGQPSVQEGIMVDALTRIESDVNYQRRQPSRKQAGKRPPEKAAPEKAGPESKQPQGAPSFSAASKITPGRALLVDIVQ
ncbi:MAG: hypothetical protein NTX50_13450 [Candidatus Sumerlaeota bacterium]|nr:hypothetical protein [Candidatus Sumerlaeota bacterium]